MLQITTQHWIALNDIAQVVPVFIIIVLGLIVFLINLPDIFMFLKSWSDKRKSKKRIF